MTSSFKTSRNRNPPWLTHKPGLNTSWTSDPRNVWFGGDISESATDSVTIDIFEAFINSGDNSNGIPAIVVLDRNFVVKDLIAGYSPTAIQNSIRGGGAVPEPASPGIAALGLGILLTLPGARYRTKTKKADGKTSASSIRFKLRDQRPCSR